MQLSLPDFKYHEAQKKSAFYDELLTRVPRFAWCQKGG